MKNIYLEEENYLAKDNADLNQNEHVHLWLYCHVYPVLKYWHVPLVRLKNSFLKKVTNLQVFDLLEEELNESCLMVVVYEFKLSKKKLTTIKMILTWLISNCK